MDIDQKDDELTIEKVKEFFEANKERADVAEYLSSLTVEKELTSETVNAYLETGEGKILLQPRLDRYATQAIKTHDEKQKPIIDATIKARVNEELIKLNPQETEADRRYRELQQNQEEMKKQWEKEKLENAINMEAAKRGIPLELASNIPYPSIEHFNNVALIWEQVKNKEVDKLVNERLASSVKPKAGDEKDEKVDLGKLSDKEILKMEMEGTLDNLLKV